jgi:TPR repeat protein
MIPRSAQSLLLAAACLAALGGTAMAQAKAKAPAKAAGVQAKAASAASSCDVLADDPEDAFRTAPGVDMHLIDPAKAVPACRAAVEAAPDDGRVRYALGRALQRAGDDAGALDAYRGAADRGYPVAENMMGAMYQGARQLETAAQWFRKAADHGYLPAQTALGQYYHNGWGVPKDPRQALGWYIKSAEQSYAPAQVVLGVMYHNGEGVPVNDAEAEKWLQQAAELGYAPGKQLLDALHQEQAAKARP